ncbi:TPA: hypothetical protein NPP59_003947 [Klebsiella pneumoniae]|nr:hypothetical protein [Klebsiella pneumoniae]
MTPQAVNELIASLESAGELSIREQKFLKLAKAFKQLAAENVALKAGVAEEIEVINRGGQMYCVKDGMSINPIYARGWNDHRANLTAVETPATDRIVAGIKADGVQQAANECYGAGYICETLLAYAKQMRDGDDK